jgi:hypothetical protein
MILLSRFAAHVPCGGAAIGSLFCREGKTIVSNPPVISVVDDDASVRVGTENLLSSLGYTVHTFASAEEFLRSAHFSGTARNSARPQRRVRSIGHNFFNQQGREQKNQGAVVGFGELSRDRRYRPTE